MESHDVQQLRKSMLRKSNGTCGGQQRPLEDITQQQNKS